MKSFIEKIRSSLYFKNPPQNMHSDYACRRHCFRLPSERCIE